jgi:hypothetical protein
MIKTGLGLRVKLLHTQHFFHHCVYKTVAAAPGYSPVFWLVGEGRSGTTWASNLLNANSVFREVFEPFHPYSKPFSDLLPPMTYLRPGDNHPQVESFARKVFSGEYSSLRSDAGSKKLFSTSLLVKDVFANLIFGWAHDLGSKPSTIFMIRHPIAVAVSKLKSSDWDWFSDPMYFCRQPKLVEDHIGDHISTIKHFSKKNDLLINYVLVWAVSNLVVLRQMRSRNGAILFYERLLENPAKEISRLEVHFQRNFIQSGTNISQLFSKPSRVSRKSDTKVDPINQIESWLAVVDTKTIKVVGEILKEFGLSMIYGSGPRPLCQINSDNVFG